MIAAMPAPAPYSEVATMKDREEEKLQVIELWKKALGQEIAAAREESGLDQTELGNMLGLTRNSLSNLERGVTAKIDNYILACIALGIDFGILAVRARSIVRGRSITADDLADI